MKYIKMLLLLLVIAEAQTTFGQGWTLTGNYAYDMTVTAVLNANCTELTNPSNKLGAFVNGELRGVALSSTVVKGRYVALLTIHSNVASLESVSFKIFNAATNNIIDATTKVLFQDDAVYGTPSDPYEIRTNSVPVNLLLATKSTQENTVPSLVTTMNVTDPDVGDTHTYSLISGVGSTDNNKFIITGNQLFSKGALNYDVQNKYKIRIQAGDNRGCSMSDSFTISLIDRNFPPTDILINKDNIDENKSVGSTVGTLSSVDQDNSDIFTYTLVSGIGADDNNKFSITGNTLVSNAVFDYETKASYKIRVQTKDAANNTFEKTFIISIENVNDKPNINDKTLGVEEYTASSFVFGNVTGTDADAGQSLTYSFINTPPQTLFGINSSTGDVSLLSNTLNYQTTTSYVLKVVARDNGSPILSDTATLTILVIYQNFPPTDISISNTIVKENSAIGTKVAELGTIDKNVEDVFTYSLVNGLNADDNSSFTINGNSLLTSAVFDFETKTSYKIRIQAKDAGNNIFQKTFTISVGNVNDKPNLNNKTLGVAEHAINGTILGTISGTDVDASQTLSYSFYSPTNTVQSIFGINASNGEISLLSNTLNYQTTQSYTFNVVALDNGTPNLSDTAILTIVVLYQNFAPTNISINNTNIKENISVGTKIAEFATFDKNTGDVFTYSLIDGLNADGNGSFAVVGNSLFTNSGINYEVQTSYNIRVQTKDLSGNTFQKTFLINVTDVNEKPKLHSQAMTIVEDATIGSVIGSLEATNEDRNQLLSFYIVNEGVPETTFKINQQTGEISLIASSLNYAIKQLYTFKVAVWDTGIPSLSDTATLEIIVLDKNHEPTELLISNNYINENKPANSFVGMFSSIDTDLGETFTYSLVSGASSVDNNQFIIKGDTLLTKSSFNFESKASYTIRVQTKDSGGNIFQQVFSIYVNDINEMPVLANQTIGVEEKIKSGTVVFTILAVDEDQNQDLTYLFVNTSSTQSLFNINPVTGNVTLISNALDYEKVKSYTLQVVAVDNGSPSMSDTATLVINVLDVIETTLPSVDYVSANGDGKNDYWFIENIDIYSEYGLMIFDANGIMVYKVDRGYDNSWNGLYNGSDLPVGAYYYVFSSNDKSRSFKGTITLVR